MVLYLSLLALSADPSLWQRFYTQENLILTKADYTDPSNSDCLHALENNPDSTVRYLAEYLEECCSLPIDQVSQLEDILNGAPTPSHSGAATPVTSPPVTPAASPAPTAASPQTTGAGSDYRSLLQMGQVVPAASTIAYPPPTAPPSVVCQQCNQVNPDELIYCDDEGCAAVLHPGSRFCAYCGESIPVKSNFCPECSEKIA